MFLFLLFCFSIGNPLNNGLLNTGLLSIFSGIWNFANGLVIVDKCAVIDHLSSVDQHSLQLISVERRQFTTAEYKLEASSVNLFSDVQAQLIPLVQQQGRPPVGYLLSECSTLLGSARQKEDSTPF